MGCGTQTGDGMFDAVEQHLDPAFATRRFGCQLEIQEFGAEMTVRRNNLDYRWQAAL